VQIVALIFDQFCHVDVYAFNFLTHATAHLIQDDHNAMRNLER